MKPTPTLVSGVDIKQGQPRLVLVVEAGAAVLAEWLLVKVVLAAGMGRICETTTDTAPSNLVMSPTLSTNSACAPHSTCADTLQLQGGP